MHETLLHLCKAEVLWYIARIEVEHIAVCIHSENVNRIHSNERRLRFHPFSRNFSLAWLFTYTRLRTHTRNITALLFWWRNLSRTNWSANLPCNCITNTRISYYESKVNIKGMQVALQSTGKLLRICSEFEFWMP